jgi:hypothetical protein
LAKINVAFTPLIEPVGISLSTKLAAVNPPPFIGFVK